VIPLRRERNGDLDAPFRAENHHPLVRRQLKRTRKHQLTAAGKSQQPAGQPVDAENRIAIDEGNGAFGLGAEHIAGGDDG